MMSTRYLSAFFQNIVTDLPECLRSDVRIDLEFQPSCANFSNYNLAALFPSSEKLVLRCCSLFCFGVGLWQRCFYFAAYSSSNDSVPDSQILTNAVPMLQAFQTGSFWATNCQIAINSKRSSLNQHDFCMFSGIWNYLMTQTIRTWADTVQNLYVLLGPAFDYDADGLPDDLQNITRLLCFFVVENMRLSGCFHLAGCIDSEFCCFWFQDWSDFLQTRKQHNSSAKSLLCHCPAVSW